MRELTYNAGGRKGITEEMAKDPTIFVVGDGIGQRGLNFITTQGLYDLYGPMRLRDTPIVERGFVGMCCGAAMTGTRPIVDFMFVDFILDSIGEIFNQIGKIQYMSSGRLKMPIVLRGAIGIGGSAATHHSGSYFPMFVNIPGLRVVVPSTPYDVKGLLKTAIRSDDPVMFLEHKSLYNNKGPVPDEEYLIPFGKANVAREGTQASVVAIGSMVRKALDAADSLAKQGISIEVIDLRTLAPLDIDTILDSVHTSGP